MPGMKAPSYMSPTELAELVGHDDQHQRRRNDLRQRAGGGDDAGGDAPVVAVAQHDRQRDQSHRDDRCRDHAGGGGEQRADENHRIGKAAAHGAEQLPDGIEQVLGHAGSFEHQSHEGEERDREQRIVAHNAVDALGQRLQEVRDEQAEFDADEREDQADRAEREKPPDSRAAGRPPSAANMIGAMLSMKNAAMLRPRQPAADAQRFSMASTDVLDFGFEWRRSGLHADRGSGRA